MPHNIYHLDPNSALGKAMTEENIALVEESKQVEHNLSIDSDRNISVVHVSNTTIQSATGLSVQYLYKDPEYKLHEEFIMEADKDNPRLVSGTILSREKIDTWKLRLGSARYVFERDKWEDFTDSKITELASEYVIEHAAPIIDQEEWRNLVYGKADKNHSLGGPRLAAKLGEPFVLSIRANGTIVYIVDAYNYIDKWGIKNRDNIQFLWKFTTYSKEVDVEKSIDKIVGKGRKLVIKDVQRSHKGYYTCEVVNSKGKTSTLTKFINVWQSGKTWEIKTGPNNDYGTGRWRFTPAENWHDIRYNKYWDYEIAKERWHEMWWKKSEQEWVRIKIVTTQANQPWKYNETVIWVKENSMKGNSFTPKDFRKHGYWKIRDNDRIYWSDSLGIVAFKTQENFFKHRKEVGYPEDFSMVESIYEGDKNPYLAEGETII